MYDRFRQEIKSGDKILYPMSHGRLVECVAVCHCIVDFTPCARFYAVNDSNKVHHVSRLDHNGICKNVIKIINK